MSFWKSLIAPVAGAATSAIISSVLTNKASKSLSKATENSIAATNANLDKVRADTAVQRGASNKAILEMERMALDPTYDHTTAPGYEFRRGEATKAVERSASARGMLESGRTMKEIARYIDQYALSDYDDQYRRLATLAGYGQPGVNAVINANSRAGNNLARIYGNQGANEAAVAGKQNRGLQGTIQNVIDAYNQSRLLDSRSLRTGP